MWDGLELGKTATKIAKSYNTMSGKHYFFLRAVFLTIKYVCPGMDGLGEIEPEPGAIGPCETFLFGSLLLYA